MGVFGNKGMKELGLDIFLFTLTEDLGPARNGTGDTRIPVVHRPARSLLVYP